MKLKIKQLEEAVWREPSTIELQVDPYIKETYGLDLSTKCSVKRTAEGDKPLNMPYDSILFASHNLDKDVWESYLVIDDGKDFNDSIAKKLIEDEKVACVKYQGMVVNFDTFEEFKADRFYLIRENRASSVFKPTLFRTIEEYSTSETVDVDVEIMFSFENAMMPVIYTVRTGGAYGLSFVDIVDEILGELHSIDDFMEFFSDEPAVIFDKENNAIVFMVSGPDYTGGVLSFEPESLNANELRNAITGFRMVAVRPVK